MDILITCTTFDEFDRLRKVYKKKCAALKKKDNWTRVYAAFRAHVHRGNGDRAQWDDIWPVYRKKILDNTMGAFMDDVDDEEPLHAIDPTALSNKRRRTLKKKKKEEETTPLHQQMEALSAEVLELRRRLEEKGLQLIDEQHRQCSMCPKLQQQLKNTRTVDHCLRELQLHEGSVYRWFDDGYPDGKDSDLFAVFYRVSSRCLGVRGDVYLSGQAYPSALKSEIALCEDVRTRKQLQDELEKRLPMGNDGDVRPPFPHTLIVQAWESRYGKIDHPTSCKYYTALSRNESIAELTRQNHALQSEVQRLTWITEGRRGGEKVKEKEKEKEEEEKEEKKEESRSTLRIHRFSMEELKRRYEEISG